MKKICLSDLDAEFFADELSTHEFDFFQKHKETFKCMWVEQGKSFWSRFFITFRSYTSKHGIVKDMPYESERLKDIMDFAFIVVHENYIDASPSSAQNFIIDIARLAQNKDKLPNLDSKKFSRDPFYKNETRDIFRTFFGPPTEKISYIKVYILFPVYLRLCGSVCRCLLKWVDAEKQDPDDVSYWTPPEPLPPCEDNDDKSVDSGYLNRVLMCEDCIDMCGGLYIQEIQNGSPDGPRHLPLWKYGNPRHEVEDNPLYDKSFKQPDWRENLNIDDFRDFHYFLKIHFADDRERCRKCENIRETKERMMALSEGKIVKKKKKKSKKNKEIESVANGIDQQAEHRKYLFGFDASNPSVDSSLLAQTMPSGRKDFFSHGVRVIEVCHNILAVKGQCRIVKIINDQKKCEEITMSQCMHNHTELLSKKKISELKSERTNVYSPHLIPNLPQMFEWAEGRGWCVAVLNYEQEEKKTHKDYTNFTLKIAGTSKSNVVSIMDCLLKYVVSRKSRPCPGWVLNEDDVLASVLENKRFKAMTIIITQGINYRNFLTEWEKRTENKIELMKVTDDEVFEVIRLVNRKFDRKPNLMFEEPSVCKEIGDGWRQYFDIVKRIRDNCEFSQQCKGKRDAKRLIEIDIINGRIDFVMYEQERFQDGYYPDLEELDFLYIKAWLKLEKLGVQTKESAVDLYTVIQQKQKSAVHEAELEQKKNGICFCSIHAACQNKKFGMKFPDSVHRNVPCHCNNIIHSSSNEVTIKHGHKIETKVIIAQGLKTLTIEKEVSKNDVTIKVNRTQLKPVVTKNETQKTQDKKNTNNTNNSNKNNKFNTRTEIPLKEHVVKNLTKTKDTPVKEEENSDSESDDDSTDEGEEEKKMKLRICFSCKETEPVFRTYKKCQKCQQERIEECRYYCGRNCQLKDWELRHRLEHAESRLK